MRMSYETREEMLAEARELGATHYSLTSDGMVGMFYRYDPQAPHRLEFLSYCDLWQASALSGYEDRVKPLLDKMVKI